MTGRGGRDAPSGGRSSRGPQGRWRRIIGFDPERGRYVTQYFGSDGPTAYEADLAKERDRSVWTMRGPDTRFSGELSADGDVITGRWERLSGDSTWTDWMDITLTKQRP